MQSIVKTLQSLVKPAAPAKTVVAAWPAPSVRPDTPALQAFAAYMRALADKSASRTLR